MYNSQLTSYTKINSMYSVNGKPKIITLLEENMERKPLWFWVRQRYLDKTSNQDP